MTPFSKTPKDAKEFLEKGWWGRVALLGANFMAGVLVLGYAGHWLDKKWGHEYRYMLIGSTLGIVWATYEAFKIAWYINQADKKTGEKHESGK